MIEPFSLTRRRFLRNTFAFSAAASLMGCGRGGNPFGVQDPVLDIPYHFLLVGDWGTYGSVANQTDVADAMKAYATKYGFTTDALLMLGDNMYGTLNGGAQSERWNTQFEKMYPSSVFNCPAFAVLGNHDYQRAPLTKVDAELAYAATGASRWTMPSRYYSLQFPQNDPVVTILALDSNMPDEKAQPLPPDSSYYTPTATEQAVQLAWLTQELQQTRTTPYLIVMGHHPVYSNGVHGDNQTLIRTWDPLFREYKVDLYLSGHDHDLQHLEFDDHPTSFVSSGGGGAPLDALSSNGRGPFAQEIHGFTHLQITSDGMTVRHLNIYGGVVHKFTKTAAGVVTILK